ncbi:hypothetical protein A2335_03720 [Candidatus Peregrinibacteria bacterium RIFOXYB2_FULL_32_7]|nr:MAG: hypothetical protein A2335_03720 [Candidatus Peregrinibacteria bacterium RIFOXYB2_FULL_32_7]
MISSSTSLYFYSAFLQGNAALIGLIAIFIVYKKQYLDSSFDRLEKIIINYIHKAIGITLNYGNIFEIETYNINIYKDINNENKIKIEATTKEQAWIKRFSELKNIDNQRKTLWKTASLPIKLIFIILGASVISLPLSDFIHLNIYLEIILFIIFTISEICTLKLLFVFIKNQLSK